MQCLTLTSHDDVLDWPAEEPHGPRIWVDWGMQASSSSTSTCAPPSTSAWSPRPPETLGSPKASMLWPGEGLLGASALTGDTGLLQPLSSVVWLVHLPLWRDPGGVRGAPAC